VSGQGHAPAALPIGQEAGRAPEPVWTQRLEEKSFSSAGIEPRSPGRPVRIQTLYCLSYPSSCNNLSELNKVPTLTTCLKLYFNIITLYTPRFLPFVYQHLLQDLGEFNKSFNNSEHAIPSPLNLLQPSGSMCRVCFNDQ
jgi:hypothetical protein